MPRSRDTQKAVELDRSRTPLIVSAFVFIGVLLTLGAIMWGRSDAGQINVSATIANSQTEETGSAPIPVPNEEQRVMPNGGLVSQNEDTPRAPEPTAPAPTGTTTDAANGETNTSDTPTESREGATDPE